MNINELAQEEATNTILSDFGGLEWDEVIAQLEDGVIPDEVQVWSVFEDYDAQNLLEVWDGFRAQFERFAKELTLKTGKK